MTKAETDNKKPKVVRDRYQREYNQYMGEVAQYLAKVRSGRRVPHANPNDPRFSERAEVERFADASKLSHLKDTIPAFMPTHREQLSTAPATIDNISKTMSDPWWKPRISLEDLRGPSGQAALASGLALSTVGGVPGFIAGATSSLLAEEGTRRLAEHMPVEYAAPLGTALSTAAGSLAFVKYPGFKIPTGEAEEYLTNKASGMKPYGN